MVNPPSIPTIIKLSLTLLLLMSFTHPVLAMDKSDWHVSDIKIAQHLKKVFSSFKEDNARALVNSINASDKLEDRDLGFGGRRWLLASYGGHATCWTTVVAFHNRVVALDMQCYFGQSWSVLKKVILPIWGDVAQEIPEGVGFQHTHKKNQDAFRTHVAEALGTDTVPTAIVPVQYSQSYGVLSSASEQYEFGDHCYESGTPPEGRSAIQGLVQAKQWHLIRGLLGSTNPEGRVYAAEALLDHAKGGEGLTENDKKTIQTIRNLDIPIRTCGGCIVFTRPARELLF